MKKDSLRVYLKVFVRLFPCFAYFVSAAWIYYMLDKLALPDIVTYIADFVVIFGHLGLLIALWNEFSGNKD